MNEEQARKYMELAVEEMKKSVAEPREDGKALPMVGVVLVLPGGEVITAHRGELRHGDHAEFTLLERKCRDRRLDGGVLFVTLEPCAPGARQPPKTACAERIFYARIDEVWIGIEDPDPTVSRKGMVYLQEKDIAVQLFPEDLQREIRLENKEFLGQALERADAVEAGRAEVLLSPLDSAAARLTFTDLSERALGQYAAKINVDDEGLRQTLLAEELLTEEEGRLRPTGFGALLFGARPRERFPQAGLIATIEHPNGEQETRDFADPLIEIPAEVESWLRPRLPNLLDRSGMERGSRGIPFEAIREGVVNALVHRDYEIEGAKVQLRVTPQSVSILSPGAPVPPITLDQIESFSAPTLSRNPKLHHVFQQMGLAEEAGFGMRTMRALRGKVGGVVPTISFVDPYLVLTLYTSVEAAATEVPSARLLTPEELQGWALLLSVGSITRREYASQLDLPARTALRHLARFVELGLASREGVGRGTRYVAVRQE
jgi:ATP-dependent DNA helicase RecG